MNTIIHYLKTRALRQIAQWFVVATFSILILGAFAVADAYAQFQIIRPSTYICSDIAGSTGGSCGIDAGCMDFDTSPPSSSFAAQICGPRMTLAGNVLNDLELHGWVWDTNLGYVSLYCDTAGKNNGVDCGSIPYGVKVNATTGDMSGWAWSDNMGWISFGCQDGLNQGYACGGINYNTSINLTVGENLGKITGYAWTDTVGWFNFQTGDVHAKILDLVMRTSMGETDWGVWTKAELENEANERIVEGMIEEGQSPEITKDIMPLANNHDGYDIFVHIADIAGTTIEDGSGDVFIEINTQWEDTVKHDQTSSTLSNGNPLNNGPTHKAGLDVDARPYSLELSTTEATTGGIINSYHGTTTSSAPTDGGNCYDGDRDESCYEGEGNFFYKDFGENIEPNTLTYLGTEIIITIPATGETWTRFIPPLYPYASGRQLEFKPIIDIPRLDYLYIPGNENTRIPLIQAIRNKMDEFYLEAIDNGILANYTIEFALSENDEDVEYVFIDDLETDLESASSTFIISNVAEIGTQLFAIPYSTAEENLQEAVPGAKLKTKVVINPNAPGVITNVKPLIVYYNNGLPRIFDSEIQTQSAQIISGGVFSPGAKKEVVQGSDVPLFGDVAVYQLRNQILSDVSDLIRGVNLRSSGLSSVEISLGGNDISGNAFKDNRLYYFKDQDVTIEDISVLSNGAPGKPVTVVVDGGDLYINDNIDKGQSFGFIVFESDTAVDSAGTTKGGRIYVHSDVTDMVNVHIFADGPVFRYADDVCYFWGNYGPSSELVGLREPNFVSADRCSAGSAGSFKEPLSVLTNQFYLKGNIASFNCLGCSTDLDPSRGDGLRLGGPSALNFAIARLYDLHYFAYFRQDPVSGDFPGNRSTNVTALEADGRITDGNAAVYFEYVPAPTDLFGFRNF